MPLPKKKISKSRRNMRRAHDFLTKPVVHNCPHCNGLIRPHHICPSCGFYKGREVLASQAD